MCSGNGDRMDAMVLVMASSWGAARRTNYGNNLTLVEDGHGTDYEGSGSTSGSLEVVPAVMVVVWRT